LTGDGKKVQGRWKNYIVRLLDMRAMKSAVQNRIFSIRIDIPVLIEHMCAMQRVLFTRMLVPATLNKMGDSAWFDGGLDWW
jgi:hypothetical protein